MATTEVAHLLDLWDRRICPYCGTHVREGARVVSGDAREGGFCSIRCHSTYYAFELAARADWSVDSRHELQCFARVLRQGNRNRPQ